MSDDEKSAKAGKPGNIALSEKEISVIAAMFRCMKEKPTYAQIDQPKFLELTGYQSIASGRNACNAVLKKLITADVDEGEVKPTPKKAPKTPKKAARAKVESPEPETLGTPGLKSENGMIDYNAPITDFEDDNVGDPSPFKIDSPSPKKRAASKVAEGESPTKKNRAPRKPKLDEDGNPIPPKPRAPRKKKVVEPVVEDDAEEQEDPDVAVPAENDGKANTIDALATPSF